MAPPSKEEIEKVVKKQYNLDQLKDLLRDYVKQEDLDMLCNFLLGASVTAQQVRAVINNSYEIKKTPSASGYSLAVNFDLTDVEPHRLDSKLPRHVMNMVLDPSVDEAKKRRLLSGLIPDAHMSKILELIKEKKIDASTMDAILNNHYELKPSAPLASCLHVKQKLDIDPLKVDEAQLKDILDGHYTDNQLCRLFKFKFSPLEVRAIFDSGLTTDQLRGVVAGNYEVERKKLEDGTGYVIELTYGKESYKDHLQGILDGKYPLETVLKLFADRLTPEELGALLKMKLTVPDLHALIIGDYVIERVDNPDGTYSLRIVYKKGAGDVKEIVEIGDPNKQTEAKKQADKPKAASPAPKATPSPRASPASKAPPSPRMSPARRPSPEPAAVKAGGGAQDASKTPSAKKKEEEPLVPAGEVKRRLKEAEEAAKAAAETSVKEQHEPVSKVKIPDLTNDREWHIEKGSMLKVPAIFASDVKPNFFKKDVKHLGTGQIKDFYETKREKARR